MRSVDFSDKWLDPPEDRFPRYGECTRCGECHDAGDLITVGDEWLCEDCAALEEE